jgi:hypothetical protein
LVPNLNISASLQSLNTAQREGLIGVALRLQARLASATA